MGELARRRRARDLWISRGHLVAGGVLVLCGLLSALGFGYVAGRADGARRTSPGQSRSQLVAELPDDALLDLLARLEATAAADASEDTIRFGYERGPHASNVESNEGTPVGPDEEAPSGAFFIDLGLYDDAEARGLQSALRDRGAPAWLVPAVAGGRMVVRLGVGGFADETEATEALRRLGPTLEGQGVEGATVGRRSAPR